MTDFLNDTALNLGEGAARGWALSEDGDLAFVGGGAVLVRGAAAIAQECRLALLLVRGEWFLDVRDGVDYFGRVWVKPPNAEDASAAFRAALLSVPGVESVRQVQLSLNAAERRLSVSYAATATDGTQVADTVEV
ncbi:hypothetical protein JYJ95_37940 [Corallococcus exiguus]|uniref:hypothetical protein n=1 Tax=Corallococcus exiguus TaxID=83462 RepID=UPI001A8D23EE|nr:hypothetical protein [Corallococcus exiguus]MBN8472319.1 hypothetical protein [Corallococcus exiguus]